MSRDPHQLLADLERRKAELVAQLVPHQESVRRGIFATVRAGLASQLHALLQSTLFKTDEVDYNGCTALHIAAFEGRQDMVRILISAGANPVAQDHLGRTPRDLAVANRHYHVAAYLLIVMKQRDGNTTEDALFRMEQSNPFSYAEGATPTILSRSAEVVNSLLNGVEEEGNADTARFSQYTTISDHVSLVVCMVGLPGRGKSYISKRIARYLNWKGVPCRVFNAGNYRRQLLGVASTAGAEFYDPNNAAAKEQRERMAQLACEDLVTFLSVNAVAVGILDATNTTVERRKHLVDYFAQQELDVLKKPVRVLFVESVCTDERIITENILRAKCGNDDFKNVADTASVVSQFRDRIKQYEKVYETLSEEEGVSYIKIMNVKQHIVLNQIKTGLGSRIVLFLMNLHPVAFPLFVVTNCQTEGNADGVFGGSCRLTEQGRAASFALKQFLLERCSDDTESNFMVLHGTNPHALATIAPLQELVDRQMIQLLPQRCLDDINYGRMNGDTVSESCKKHPKRCAILYETNPDAASAELGLIADERLRHIPSPLNPVLNYCVQFPCGESCRQVNVRLESALMNLMRCGCPALVVAPDIPAQGVLAFFTDMPPEVARFLAIPRHTIVEISKGTVQLHQLSTEHET